MLAVGDGSCFLLTIAPRRDEDRTRPHTIMFDCGSLAYLGVGVDTVTPALHQLGVRRIDSLILSHADLDHFCGVLDVMDRVPVGRVLVPPQLMAEAAHRSVDDPPAASFLIEQLRLRGKPIETITRGWRTQFGSATLEALWPPADFVAERANDTSIVMSVRVALEDNQRRVLLNADIQQSAMTALLEGGVDLKADVSDLPHHGSFVRSSPKWLQAVDPVAVLQSCGRRRLREDPWSELTHPRGIRHFITARHGMVELMINVNGDLQWRTFHDDSDMEKAPP